MNASIISPVSRHLVVADVPRSMDFYVSRLGFENMPGDLYSVRSGMAKISFHNAANGTENNRAIVFFETDDVHAMHQLVQSRLRDISPPEKVNWIKMEMFPVTDPDGHQLWFGKSFHHEYDVMHSGQYDGQLRTIMPTLPCKNVPAAVQYYVSVLGFSVNYEQHDFAVLDRDRVRILLMQGNDKNTGAGQCYVYVQRADELYRELLQKGAAVNGEPVSQPWGLREFFVKDIDGNTIGLGQTFE